MRSYKNKFDPENRETLMKFWYLYDNWLIKSSSYKDEDRLPKVLLIYKPKSRRDREKPRTMRKFNWSLNESLEGRRRKEGFPPFWVYDFEFYKLRFSSLWNIYFHWDEKNDLIGELESIDSVIEFD